MIVNSLKDGWEIIYQRAHANLAAMILNGWAKSENIYRRTETMIAVAQHDDQEMFWDSSEHLTEQGAPMDFMQGSFDTTIEQVPLVVANAYRQGLWIALMISMHNSYLYESKRGTSETVDRFLDQQAEYQRTWCKLLQVTKKVAEQNYSYMLFADTLSLILCRRHLPMQGRRLQVSAVSDQRTIMVFEREDKTIGLDPWIFEEDTIEFSLETRRLSQLVFKNELEFKTALDNATLEVTAWKFTK